MRHRGYAGGVAYAGLTYVERLAHKELPVVELAEHHLDDLGHALGELLHTLGVVLLEPRLDGLHVSLDVTVHINKSEW